MELLTLTAAAIMSMYMNAAQNTKSDYCYNAEIENGRVTTQYVYRETPKALTPHRRHGYEYDEQGRLTARTTYGWNTTTDEWQPVCRWLYSYTAAGYSVEIAYWDARHARFAEPTSKSVYALTAFSTVAYVTTYTRKEPGAPYEIAETLLACNPQQVSPLDLADNS